jgi:Family of unknown function (DUF5999)
VEDDVCRCQHTPRCPDAQATDRGVAKVVASHPEQGWSLLCNGVVLFDDAGELLLDAPAVAPSPATAGDPVPGSHVAA